MAGMRSRKLGEGIPLADLLKEVPHTFLGEKSCSIKGLCAVSDPLPYHLAFIRETSPIRVQKYIDAFGPGALLISSKLKDLAPKASQTLALVDNPQGAFVRLVPRFYESLGVSRTVSPRAEVDPTASIGKDVSIGAFSSVGAECVIEEGVTIFPHVVLYPDVIIGRGTIIHSGVVIREGCRIGAGCILQSGAVIGADGFGYMADPAGGGMALIPQVGIVEISSKVEIGANACIDRATIGRTRIGDGTKIDNLVQVGHNTAIGKHSIVCGGAGIAGSCNIGNQVTIGGNAGIRDHATIVDGVRVAGQSGVTGNLLKKADYAGYPAQEASEWRRLFANLKKLPALIKNNPNLQNAKEERDDEDTAS